MRDIYTDPAARAEWEALGVGVVPAITDGDRRLPIFHPDQIRGFLGLAPATDTPPYQSLAAALERVLEAVERAVAQVPTEHLDDPTPNRGRGLRELAFNIHDPITLMRDALDTGRFDWRPDDDFARSRQLATADDLVQFCRDTRVSWYARAAAVPPDDASRPVETPRGRLTQIQLLDAQARHAAQHLRQIYQFLRQRGIEPVQPLTAEQMRPIALNEVII